MNVNEFYGGYMIFNAMDSSTSLTDESDKKLLTPKEAAKFLNVSLRTIWEWKGRKIIPYYEFGGFLRKRIRFHRDELLAFGKKNAEQNMSKSLGGFKNED
jgi:excisionase family DNA binding protein